MTLEIWILYVATVLALMSTPGPSQLLMLSNSATHGFQRSLATACGDVTANLIQMLAAGFGLVAILAASANALTIIKWLGVAYLIWLGIQKVQKANSGEDAYPALHQQQCCECFPSVAAPRKSFATLLLVKCWVCVFPRPAMDIRSWQPKQRPND